MQTIAGDAGTYRGCQEYGSDNSVFVAKIYFRS